MTEQKKPEVIILEEETDKAGELEATEQKPTLDVEKELPSKSA